LLELLRRRLLELLLLHRCRSAIHGCTTDGRLRHINNSGVRRINQRKLRVVSWRLELALNLLSVGLPTIFLRIFTQSPQIAPDSLDKGLATAIHEFNFELDVAWQRIRHSLAVTRPRICTKDRLLKLFFKREGKWEIDRFELILSLWVDQHEAMRRQHDLAFAFELAHSLDLEREFDAFTLNAEMFTLHAQWLPIR